MRYYESCYEQIQNIFIHEILFEKKYMFLEIKEIFQKSRKNEMLNFFMLRHFNKKLLIELSNITKNRLYMLSIIEENTNENKQLRLRKLKMKNEYQISYVLHVNWNLTILWNQNSWIINIDIFKHESYDRHSK